MDFLTNKKTGEVFPTDSSGVSSSDFHNKESDVISTNVEQIHMKNQEHIHKLPNVDIDKHYWGFETEDGKIKKVRLGNWSDTGWHWDDDESGINLFLDRLGEEIQSEFISEMREHGITFDEIKPIMLKYFRNDDENGLYSLTGDNGEWRFGTETDSSSEFDYFFENEGSKFSEKQQEKIRERTFRNYNGITFEDLMEEHGDSYRKQLKKFINESESFDDYFKKIHSWEGFRYGIEEDKMILKGRKFGEAIRESVKELEKEKEI